MLVPMFNPEQTSSRIGALGKVRGICGNYAIRASVKAMRQVFALIRASGGAADVLNQIASVEDILQL